MRKTLGLRSKVILAFFFAVLGCMAMLGVACQLALRPLLVWDSRRQMENCLTEIEAVNAGTYRDDTYLQEVCSKIYDKELIGFVFFEKNEEGKFSHYTMKRYSGATLKGTRKAFREYLQTGIDPYVVERTDEDNQINRLYFIKKIEEGRYLLMNKSIRGLDQLTRMVSTFVMISGAVIAVIGCILWICLTRSFMMQIIKISQVTKNISELNFDQKLNFRGQDEVGVLAESVDELSDRLEASIDGMQRELERRKTLIRNLTHELRTPLTTIQGYTENLQLALAGMQRERRFCDIILEECGAMDQLVKEMLELSRLEKGKDVYKKKDLDIGEVFGNVRRQTATVFPEADIHIQFDSQTLYANPLLLERVITNYLKNAVRYGEPGGSIWLTGGREDDVYVIAVTNEGCSLTEEDQERIWEAFYKTDKSRKRSGGYGVGLAIVQEIAHIHKARVGVRCADGKTTFSFCIPLEK